MTYVITQSCCSDATCVRVCPVGCIHPAPGEPDFGTTDQLYVDSGSCIDCGACADACPVDAAKPAERLTAPESIFSALADDYYRRRSSATVWGVPDFPDFPDFPAPLPVPTAGLRVAVVGTGPAASYAVAELLHRTEAELTVIDRLPVPGGLVRAGVAPDHPSTKRVGERFAALWHHPRVTLVTNVEVGRDVTREEVLDHHHAIVYASGASQSRRLGVPGEDLPGSLGATDLVRWYNADPAVVPVPDLATQRVVVAGSGNVALDVARTLSVDPASLHPTDVAEAALDALRTSAVREVLVLARRGPDAAAYTSPELVALAAREDVDLVVADDARTRAAIASAAPGSRAALLADLPLVDLGSPVAPGRRRVVLVFHASVTQILGGDRVEAVRLARLDQSVTLATGLFVAAVGHRGRPVPGLPFDVEGSTVPHHRGAVVDGPRRVPGTYVTGWVKRGASGGIGANRACALETVDTLLSDLGTRGVLPLRGSRRGFERLVTRRRPERLGLREVLAIDAAERERGRATGRPRVKLATLEEQVATARA